MNPHAAQGEAARHLRGQALAQALSQSRQDTLALFATLQAALGQTPDVPYCAELNPPLWELGHIGWFQAHFLGLPKRRAGADELYDSGRVPHGTRWQLPLPDPQATQADLAQQLDDARALLASLADADDDARLEAARLVLFHEDMHHEAGLYMAQALDVPVADARWQMPALTLPREPLRQAAGLWRLGWQGPGFAFDNELQAVEGPLPATEIDSRVLSWAEYLPCVEAGAAPGVPRYLRQEAGRWQQRRHGAWRELDLAEPACHLSLTEAQAWCAWAGRRLPSEAEWERAACSDERFHWGLVWEWTSSRFEPYPGFEPHRYRDYSAPWFGSRQVLRGASFMTQPRLHHRRYRNFFTPERSDFAAGFRSCAL